MAISQEEINNLNKTIIFYVRKIFKGKVGITTDDINDVVQETWRLFFENGYNQKPKPEARKVAITICIRQAASFAIGKSKSLSTAVPLVEDSNELEGAPANQEEIFNIEFLAHKKQQLLAMINQLKSNQAFIMQAVIIYEIEQQFSQEQTLEKIQGEYKKKFGKVLSVNNYRKIKERAIKKLQELAKYT